ncbi:MAG: hypothetical protein M1530_03265 [Candidatus Marsarchaeota archaeon]|nr:hypothetical protein [Candidatus Marsarchaeota archaeon]
MKTKTTKAKANRFGCASSGRALLYTGGLIIAAMAILYLSSVLLPQLKFIEDLRSGELMLISGPEGSFIIGPDISAYGSYFALRLLLSLANIALVIYLLFLYVRDYLHFRTSFALGIVAFLFSFLLYALASMPFIRFMGQSGFADIFSFVPLLFSGLGLVIFAKLSNE